MSLAAKLWSIVLASELSYTGCRKTSLLVCLQLCKLKRVERLACEHVWWLDQHLTLWQLHKLRLRLVLLEGMHAANRLIVYRATLAVSWLEWLGSSMLVHLEIAHILLLRLVD